MSGRNDVSPLTRTRVEQAIQQPDYRSGKNRLPSRPGPLEAVIDDFRDQAVLDVLRGVEGVAQAASTGTFVSALQGRSVNPQWRGNLAARRLSAIVLVTSRAALSSYAMLRRLGTPVIVVDLSDGCPPDVPAVGVSSLAAGTLAIHHLLSLGHRRVGFVAAAEELTGGSARLI